MVALYDDNMTLEKILLIGHKSRQNFVSFIFESNDTQTYLHQKNYSMKTMSMMKKLLQNTFLFISNNPYCEMQLSSIIEFILQDFIFQIIPLNNHFDILYFKMSLHKDLKIILCQIFILIGYILIRVHYIDLKFKQNSMVIGYLCFLTKLVLFVKLPNIL